MYEEVLSKAPQLKGKVPRFYGTYMRPRGGWFVLLMEAVGNGLEDDVDSMDGWRENDREKIE
jgi:hypothetical protein